MGDVRVFDPSQSLHITAPGQIVLQTLWNVRRLSAGIQTCQNLRHGPTVVHRTRSDNAFQVGFDEFRFHIFDLVLKSEPLKQYVLECNFKCAVRRPPKGSRITMSAPLGARRVPTTVAVCVPAQI